MKRAPAAPNGSPGGVLLRRLGPADAPAYRALMLAAYRQNPDAFTSSVAEREHLPLAWWAERIGAAGAHSTQVFGAFVGPLLAGAAGLMAETRERLRHRATLFGMTVAAAHRRQGLAQSLVHAVLAAARQQPGLRVVQLTVSDHNAAAIALYERNGFGCFGIEPLAIQLGETMVVKRHMALDLHPPLDTLQWADSEVSRVLASAEGLELHFSAASVQRKVAGQASVAGHLSGVQLRLVGPLPPLQLAEWRGRLSSGRLLQPGQATRQLLLPYCAPGPVDVELCFAQGAELRMQALRLQADVAPAARFSASMAC